MVKKIPCRDDELSEPLSDAEDLGTDDEEKNKVGFVI